MAFTVGGGQARCRRETYGRAPPSAGLNAQITCERPVTGIGRALRRDCGRKADRQQQSQTANQDFDH
jgi:hypothetical protein